MAMGDGGGSGGGSSGLDPPGGTQAPNGGVAVMDDLEGLVGRCCGIVAQHDGLADEEGVDLVETSRVIGKDEGLVPGSWVALTMWQSTWDFAISCQSRLPNAP